MIHLVVDEVIEHVETEGRDATRSGEEARRGIVLIDVDRISKSCRYGVPLMDVVGERNHFELSKRKRLRTMGPDQLAGFQAERNATSIDGLPAVDADRVRSRASARALAANHEW